MTNLLTIYLIGFALALILILSASRETIATRAGGKIINWRRTDGEMLAVAALWPLVLVLWAINLVVPDRRAG